MIQEEDLQIIEELNALKGDDKKRATLSGFFKTGKGQYAEGDVMLGVTVPNTRSVAQKHKDASFETIHKLLQSEVHEVRFCGLLILVEKFKQTRRIKNPLEAREAQTVIFNFYLDHDTRINNWDLVDLSAPQIVGQYLLSVADRTVLYTLANDSLLWRRRIAVVSTLTFIRNQQFADTLRLVEILMHDPEDLMRKALGWVLREIGKKDEPTLLQFLDKYHKQLERTTLRYAIERLTPELRKHYMAK